MIFGSGISSCVTGCPCGVWWRGLATFPQFVGPIVGKSTLNMLGPKFDRMENISFYHKHDLNMLLVTNDIYMYYQLRISAYLVYCHLSNSF